MTVAQLTLAFQQWRDIHESFHGELPQSERELCEEILAHLRLCAQIEADNLVPSHA